MPQVITGFDKFAQSQRQKKLDERTATLQDAQETRAVAQERRAASAFEMAAQDRVTANANAEEDRKYQAQVRWGNQFKQDIAVLGTLTQPVPIELVPGVAAMIPPAKAAGAKYATFSRNGEGLVTGVDYYAEENDPAPMYQLGLDAAGLADEAASNWQTYESQTTQSADGTLTANVVQVNSSTGETRVLKANLGKDVKPAKEEKPPTPGQEATDIAKQEKLMKEQAMRKTNSALAPVRPWMIASEYGKFKDPYEAKGSVELLIQEEESLQAPNARKVTALKEALKKMDSIISELDGGTPAAPAGKPGGGGTVDPSIYDGTGL